VVTDGAAPHRVIQPVERPAGWAPPAPPPGITSHPPTFAHRMVASRAQLRPSATAMGGFAGSAPAAPVAPSPTASFAGAAPLPPTSADDGLVTELLDRERRRLMELAGAPVPRRREALADLASWLGAVDRPSGVQESLWDELLAALRRASSEDRAPGRASGSGQFEAMWAEVLRLIEGILGSSAPSGSIRRSTFWKHRGET
jgi:Ca-activated chloride channel family protein